jgi:dTDP-glucose 4,6-dehydratase
MDISKIADELGWQPTEDLLSGLEKTVDWYLDNLEWVNSIRDEDVYADWMNINYGSR